MGTRGPTVSVLEESLNLIIEKKLASLTEEACQHGIASVYAVLQLLHDCYVAGKHKEFAKHCCQFSPISLTQSKVDTTPAEEKAPYLQ